MSSPEQELLLGRIAVHHKLISMDQLVEATLQQGKEGPERRLGDIFVENGWITQDQLQKLLEIQKDLLAKHRQAQAAAGRGAGAPAPATATGPAVKATSPAAAQSTVPAARQARAAPVAASGSSSASGRRTAPSSAAPEPAAPPGGLPASEQMAPPEPGTTWPTLAPRSKGLDTLLMKAVQLKASDIHVHAGAPIKMRISGRLIEAGGAPAAGAAGEQLLLQVLTEEQRRHFEDQGEIDFAYTIPDVGRFRANIYRQLRGVDGTFRLIPPAPPSLEDLGLPSTLAKLTNHHQGMVLVTGPAGCGKSTTLAALLNIINEERRDHILTIEDPIECLHPSKRCVVNQRQVGRHTESFARALRAALREDPDVIAIGELRDLETISLAITAAETGHLVLATLHTNNSIRTINRVLGVFPPDQQPQIRTMLSESLRAIISQRLIPTADGKGRVAALEVLICNKAVANLIREDKTFQVRSVLQTGGAQGMCLLDHSLASLLKAGTISRDEALRNCEETKRFAA